jgi:hypothetical protein
VHGDIIYVLDGNGLLHITRKRQTTTIKLDGAHQAGSITIDGDDFVVLRNMIPLDEPRDILRYSKGGELVERAILPGDPVMQRPLQLPHDELLIFPQTISAISVGGRYLVSNSDGRRWLFEPGAERVRAFPDYSYSAKENRLELILGTGKIVIPTTGKGVNLRFLGLDQQGREYWVFTDFHDHHNQRQIVIRAGKGEPVFADITGLTDTRLNTWVGLNPETGQIYTANTSNDIYRLYRLSPWRYTNRYPAWKPQPAPNWYNANTDQIITREAQAAEIAMETERLWLEHHRSTKYMAVTRSQVFETAMSYVNHPWVMDIDMNGANPVNQVKGMLPRWIDQQADGTTIRGLPYCWGGSVTLDRFDYHLSQGWQAGNIEPLGGWQRGTTGVDCSGFIWNCYGYSTRPGRGRTGITSPFFWTRIPNNQLVWMDMVRKPGHVVLFLAREPNNPDLFYTIEATGAQANDRVMMWYRHFSEGFQGLRYNGFYRAPSEQSPKPCPGGQVFMVHRAREEILSRILADGTALWHTRTLETHECNKCGQHWIRKANLSEEYR